MKQNGLLPLARLTSSLSLFGILLFIHMSFTLAYFLPAESKEVMNAVYSFFFAGNVLGAVLCPLFLPLPGRKNKSLAMSLCFIAFLIAVELLFRFLGVSVWLNSVTIRSIMTLNEGILNSMCYGLFYLTWLRPAPKISGAGRTGGACSLIFSVALLGSVLVRYYSVPLLEAGIAAKNPLEGVALIFNCIKWGMIVLGASAAVSVFITHNTAGVSPLTGENTSAEGGTKTNWSVILRLIGLASVFTILNGVLNMRMLPLYSSEAIYHPHYLTVAATVPVLGFLAGRSISHFFRWFTPPAIILFILMSCLPLFEGHPRFNMIMSTPVAIAYYTAWVVFTTAVVEYYVDSGHANGGHYHGFWFYGMTTAVFFTIVFAFLAPVIDPFVPDDTEYRVLFIVIAAVSFMLLAFRLLFPKQRQEPHATFSVTSTLEGVFKERGLSQREIEVAHLLVKEGLGKEEVGKRLYISAGTAKLHISKIYQKFAVKTRAEFMALFVNREQ